MSISNGAGGPATIGVTEYSLANASTVLTPKTTAVYLTPYIDLSAMAAGDQFRIRVYEKANGVQFVIWEGYPTGAQAQAFSLPAMQVSEGWDVTIKKIAGTDRAVGWSLHSDNSDANVASYASGQAPLQPTTVGRTLDVTVTGEAGIDWANIGAPTTVVALSGTSIKTSTDVATDVTTLLARLTAVRAGYLDNLSAGAVATAANLAIVAGYVDTEITTIITNLATAQADLTTLTGRITALRAGYLDNLSAGAVSTAALLATAQTDLTTLTGRLTALRAGYLDNLSAAIATAANLATAQTGITAIKAKTDNLPADPASAATNAASFAVVNTATTAIKAKTDGLPPDPADASDIAASFGTVNATLATIAGYIDTEVASIKATVEALPSAAAVAVAVLGATVEGTMTAARTLRALGRMLVWGKRAYTGTVPNSTITVRDKADTKTTMTIATTAVGWTSATMDDPD